MGRRQEQGRTYRHTDPRQACQQWWPGIGAGSDAGGGE